MMLHQIGFTHSAILAEWRVFLFGKDEIRQIVISVQGLVQSVLFIIDMFFHKECLLCLISCKVKHETAKEANVHSSRDLLGSQLHYFLL